MSQAATRPGTLYLCATPIGNLEDITLRVLRILQEVHLIAAEDTRRTKKLLNHYNITTPLVSYHEHNRKARGEELLGRLQGGEDIALVSDAGMPGIADPGTELVQRAVAAGIPLVALPGPTALISALVVSGLPTDSFVFVGFPPRKGREREEFFNTLAAEGRTAVFYEAPHRLLETLTDLRKAAGDRWLVVARELTKQHEEIRRGPIGQHLEHFRKHPPRGEFCLVLSGAPAGEEENLTPGRLQEGVELVQELVALGVAKKEAIRVAARERKLPKNALYTALLAIKK
ncbi:MAG TPA: 16S rRNA (cytidine(1402)-2'-O)-methyltransferase [Firmicutes bacterium]|nr:16S rRNA (cytidine(1402)-2'-O)-methyltransferase [Bacillota bacterium]